MVACDAAGAGGGIDILIKAKALTINDCQGFVSVGMTGFEPATTRPPDAYSNRAELHPALFCECKGNKCFRILQQSCKNILMPVAGIRPEQ